MQAVANFVIVKIVRDEAVGLIYIPEKSRQYNSDFHGEVISVGPEVNLDIKPGDKISFRRHEGFELSEGILSVHERHIGGVYDPSDKR